MAALTIEEMQEFFDKETTDPDTQDWREWLTPYQERLVEIWDRQREQEFVRIAEAFADLRKRQQAEREL